MKTTFGPSVLQDETRGPATAPPALGAAHGRRGRGGPENRAARGCIPLWKTRA